MKVPKYWARGRAEGMDPTGKTVTFTCWGWSERDRDEAERMGRDRAGRALAKFLSGGELGRYGYGDRPLREEIVQKVAGRRGDELGLVTRNGYGALVLNAGRAMFIDVDFGVEDREGCVVGLWNALRGKSEVRAEQRALARVEAWAEAHRELDLRVYRTFAGLRLLVTNQTFDPARPETEALLTEIKSDPLYIRLCRQQECFRARLTPKPWRIRLGRPPFRFPFETAEQEQAARAWEREYERETTHYGICRLLKQIGSSAAHAEVGPVLALHDQYCLRDPGLDLA